LIQNKKNPAIIAYLQPSHQMCKSLDIGRGWD